MSIPILSDYWSLRCKYYLLIRVRLKLLLYMFSVVIVVQTKSSRRSNQGCRVGVSEGVRSL